MLVFGALTLVTLKVALICTFGPQKKSLRVLELDGSSCTPLEPSSDELSSLLLFVEQLL